jgi:hypothetical protein
MNDTFGVNVTNIYGATAGDTLGVGAIINDDSILIATTTTLTSNPSLSGFGQSVTFTAMVTGSMSSPIRTGTVTFSIDGVPQTPVTLIAGTQATFTTSSLSVGAHTIEASYSGDAYYAGSAAPPLTHLVNAPAFYNNAGQQRQPLRGWAVGDVHRVGQR